MDKAEGYLKNALWMDQIKVKLHEKLIYETWWWWWQCHDLGLACCL